MTIDLHDKQLKISFLWKLPVKIQGIINSSIKIRLIWLKTKKLQLKLANLFYKFNKCVNKFCFDSREIVQKLSMIDTWRLHGDVFSLARHVHQYLCRCMEPAVLKLRFPETRRERNHRRREILATNSCRMAKETWQMGIKLEDRDLWKL